MIDAVKKFYGNYTNFSGRSTRGDYWWVALFNFIVGMVLNIPSFIAIAIDSTGLSVLSSILALVWGLANLVPSIALCIRRLHDIGKPGIWYLWCILLSFVCGIGGIVMIVFMCMDSVPDNQYGPNPKMMGYGMGYGQQPMMNNQMYGQQMNQPMGGQYNQQMNQQYGQPMNGQYNQQYGQQMGNQNIDLSKQQNNQYNNNNGQQF